MATTTQYNPNAGLNQRLVEAGASKTVYALVTPEAEAVKRRLFGSLHPALVERLVAFIEGRLQPTDKERALFVEALTKPNFSAYLDLFRDAWTGKQDALHGEFFDTWHAWSSPVVDLDRAAFPFFYPTAGASEALRHLIFDLAASNFPRSKIHIFEGEYEGYKAMAEAAGIRVVEHKRANWSDVAGTNQRLTRSWEPGDLFFLSQPSAIDGNVWAEFNAFVAQMPENSIVADITYVGAVPRSALNGEFGATGPVPESSKLERFNLSAPSIRNIVFSLSKPFGVYYDRIGGVFAREENLGLFGNRWFKNLTSLALGTALLKAHDVFALPEKYCSAQGAAIVGVGEGLMMSLKPAHVYILATGLKPADDELSRYLARHPGAPARVCLTPAMADLIGTTDLQVLHPNLIDILAPKRARSRA